MRVGVVREEGAEKPWPAGHGGLALALVLLLSALPLGAASGEPHDLVVTLRDGATMSPPAGAILLGVVPGFVVPDASPALEASLLADSRVESVARAERLVSTVDPNLLLTRAEPAPAAASGVPFAGRGVTIAVVDSGIDRAHPDLAGRVTANVKLLDGKFVESAGDLDGHGTHVAGIAAGDGSSTDGKVRGVATEARLVGVDISDRFTTASALLAYDWLYANRERHGIDVVVNAWGRVGEDRAFDPADAEVRAIDRLVDAGVIVLFSASNHGPGPSTLSLEAQNPRVVTVGAVDAAARLMAYSSRGPVQSARGDAAWVKPDVVAPGDTILGLRSGQAAPDANADGDLLHRYYSGTSQSVPHVAGIVALMLEANPTLTPTQVLNALRESAVDLGAPGPDAATGFGLVDAQDAVHRALGEPNDRGNVLVAGGVDRFEDEAALAAPPRAGGGLLGLASVPSASWSTIFPVKDGATGIEFDLEWNAPVSRVTVTLERDGQAMGSWSRPDLEASRAVVRGRIDAPEPGIWTLRAQGAAPAPLEVSSVVHVTVKAAPARALDIDPRYRLPDPPPSARGEANAAFSDVAVQVGFPVGVAGGALVAAFAWRPKRARTVREAVLEAFEAPEASADELPPREELAALVRL